VVVWWFKDLDVIFIMFGIFCTLDFHFHVPTSLVLLTSILLTYPHFSSLLSMLLSQTLESSVPIGSMTLTIFSDVWGRHVWCRFGLEPCYVRHKHLESNVDTYPSIYIYTHTFLHIFTRGL
jgi:hypothetical protein